MIELETTRKPADKEGVSTKKVLIVDENLEQTNLMRHGLQFHELPFETDVLSSVNDARNYLAEQTPDMLILELKVADGSTRELIPQDPESSRYPVVILTEKGSETDAVDSLKAGVLDYVVKTRRKCQEVGDLVKRTLASWSRIRSIRKAELNLQQTLRLARSIMDSLPAPIGVLDDRGRLLSVNRAWRSGNCERIFFGEQCDLEDDYLSYCRSLEHPAAVSIAHALEQVVHRQSIADPVVYGVGDTQDTWYSLSIHPCTGSGRARAIVVHQDVSDTRCLEVSRSLKEQAIEKFGLLTPREKQVMDLVVEGKPNKFIARNLGISVKTVEMHRSNLMKKLKIRSVTDLVRLAVNACGRGSEIPDVAE